MPRSHFVTFYMHYMVNKQVLKSSVQHSVSFELYGLAAGFWTLFVSDRITAWASFLEIMIFYVILGKVDFVDNFQNFQIKRVNFQKSFEVFSKKRKFSGKIDFSEDDFSEFLKKIF